MDPLLFESARNTVLSESTGASGIGTLSEKTLHKILKFAIDPDPSHHEVPVLGSVADILNEDGITEIQTRSLERLLPKLRKFLPEYPVTVVYPQPYEKYLRWIDPDSGEISGRRRSPKRSTPCDAFRELGRLRSVIADPHLRLRLIFLDVEEFRYRNGWDKTGKRGSTRMERIPIACREDSLLVTDADFRDVFLPGSLPDPFSAKQFSAATRQKSRFAYEGLRLLMARGIIAHTETRGREFLYSRLF